MDLSLVSSVPWLFEPLTLLLLVGGFGLGIFSVVMSGGGFFLSIPLFQLLFPTVSYGAIVGNLKLGSFFRGIGSTWENRREIEFVPMMIWSLPILVGTVLGVTVIAQLDQRWILPFMVLAVVLSEWGPILARNLRKTSFYGASVLTGAYTGFLGAGSGFLILSLLRLRYPDDTQIGHAKIQSSFLEWFVGITAVVVHFFHGNLMLELWLAWSIGSLAGGVVGAKLLRTMGRMPGFLQKGILRASFVVALAVAAAAFFK